MILYLFGSDCSVKGCRGLKPVFGFCLALCLRCCFIFLATLRFHNFTPGRTVASSFKKVKAWFGFVLLICRVFNFIPLEPSRSPPLLFARPMGSGAP